MTARLPFTYRRIGAATYEIVSDGAVAGTVWRTRTGWSGATASGRQVVDDYPGSRGVAAANVIQYNQRETEGN